MEIVREGEGEEAVFAWSLPCYFSNKQKYFPMSIGHSTQGSDDATVEQAFLVQCSGQTTYLPEKGELLFIFRCNQSGLWKSILENTLRLSERVVNKSQWFITDPEELTFLSKQMLGLIFNLEHENFLNKGT